MGGTAAEQTKRRLNHSYSKRYRAGVAAVEGSGAVAACAGAAGAGAGHGAGPVGGAAGAGTGPAAAESSREPSEP